MRLKNFYTVRPNEIKAGDVFAVTVTCYVDYIAEDGTVYVSLYRCPYPDAQISGEGIPQGDDVYKNKLEIAGTLFPVLNSFRELMSF